MQRRAAHLKDGIMRRGDTVFQQSKTILLIEHVTRFVLAFLLSAATIFSGLSPFAVAFTASAGAGTAGLVTLLGAVLGYLLLGGFFWALKYVAISVLVFAAAFVFRILGCTGKSGSCRPLRPL